MFRKFLVILFILSPGLAGTSCHNETSKANLTVHTRTGTFTGNLNDTYPDVRQFKYIPYAKAN